MSVRIERSNKKHWQVWNNEILVGNDTWKWQDLETGLEPYPTGRGAKPTSFQRSMKRCGFTVEELQEAISAVQIKPVEEEAPKTEEQLPVLDHEPTMDEVIGAMGGDMELNQFFLIQLDLARREDIRNLPNLNLVGDEQTGKSWYINLIASLGDYAYGSDKVTPQALLPAGKDAGEPLAKRINNKVWCIDELGQVLSNNPEAVNAFFGNILSSYGKKEISCDSNTGTSGKVPCHYCALFGQTPDIYRHAIEYFKSFGARFLMYYNKNDCKDHFEDDTTPEQINTIRTLIQNKLFYGGQRVLPILPKEVKDAISDFTRKLAQLRSLESSRTRGHNRFLNVMANIVKSRALLWNREPTVEDVRWAERFFYNEVFYKAHVRSFLYGTRWSSPDQKDVERRARIREGLLSRGIFVKTEGGELRVSDEWREMLYRIFPAQEDAVNVLDLEVSV